MREPLLIAIFLLSVSVCSGTTWEVAYPYRQHIAGQDIDIVAYPFDPYCGSPLAGETKVYRHGRLLYSMDKYYREKLFASKDGHYIAVVRTSNLTDVTSMVTFGTEQLDFSQSAIQIFKDGKLAKKITLRDIADTAKLPNNGKYFSWGYRFNKQAYEDARWRCESCNEIYGRHILATCDTSEIDLNDCLECRTACDSAAREAGELKLAANSVFVRRDTLYVLTCLGYALSMPFKSFEVGKVPFNKAVPDPIKFSPQEISRKYSHVTYPEQFGLPSLADGKRLDKALAAYLGMSILEKSADSLVRMTVHCHMMIDRRGKCAMAECEVDIHDGDNARRKASKEEGEMGALATKWVLEQRYDPSSLPEGAERFFYRDYFFLK